MPLRLAKALGLLPLDRALAIEDRKRQRILEIERKWLGWREREREYSSEKMKRERMCVLKWASEFIINK